MSTYHRIIPRDFFNEGKLLTCLGLLSLRIINSQLPHNCEITIDESGKPFDIQAGDDGSLFVSNYATLLNDREVCFKIMQNNRSKYPLDCSYQNTDYRVFTEEGDWDDEFLELVNQLQPC